MSCFKQKYIICFGNFDKIRGASSNKQNHDK